MDETDSTISAKARQQLISIRTEYQEKIKKLKRKRKIIKIMYYLSIIASISISTIIASLPSIAGIPPLTITILSITSGILTGLSAKFNLQNKKDELNKTIENLYKIETEIEYVISCNGNFSREDYKQLLSRILIL